MQQQHPSRSGPDNESDFAEALQDALFEDFVFGDAAVRSFEEAGVLTSNVGLVVRFPNGAEFQLTVVRSR